MLQQILQDLYVDPEILAELDEDQKQMLFVKMREEQVRRYKEREERFEREEQNNRRLPKKGGKRVDFLRGTDGHDWVWVMGEHRADLSIEEILEQEAQRAAQTQAEEEANALREKEEKELKEKIEAEKMRIQQENERLEMQMKEKEALSRSSEKAREEVKKIAQLKQQYEQREQKKLKELNEQQKILRRKSQESLENVKKRRSCEIYVRWKEHRSTVEREAEEGSKQVEETWKEQEEKSKEAEEEMRDIARRARLEYKESLRRSNSIIQATRNFRSSITPPENKPPLPPKKHLQNHAATGNSSNGSSKPRPLRPRNRNMVLNWFIKEEKEKGSGTDPLTGNIADWFHGIISRVEAEKLLADKATGAFLVRVSERVWGYTISYQERSRCKHFLIDTTDLGYQFFGANQVIHKSLAELVAFHKETPITISGKEILKEPCGQVSDPPDYADLFQESKTEFTPL